MVACVSRRSGGRSGCVRAGAHLEVLPHGADHLAGDHVARLVRQDVDDEDAVAAQEALDEALPEALVVAARRRRERLHVLEELADERAPRAQEQQPLEPDENAERAGHRDEQEPEPEEDLRGVALRAAHEMRQSSLNHTVYTSKGAQHRKKSNEAVAHVDLLVEHIRREYCTWEYSREK